MCDVDGSVASLKACDTCMVSTDMVGLGFFARCIIEPSEVLAAAGGTK